MTSGKQARRQRQQAVARPPVRSTGGRKASPTVLIGVLVAIAVIVAAVAAVLLLKGNNSKSNSSTTATVLSGASEVTKQFAGIPQHGDVLGKASAPATMVEYIDLQCPVCRDFETSVMPSVIDRYVRAGKLKVIARPVAIIGSRTDSQRGRLGMIAASKQNRAFNFAQLLYFNQGPEDGGWLDDSMVASAAKSIPGVKVAALQAAAKSTAVADQAKTYDTEATKDGLSGTPTVLVGPSGGKLTVVAPGLEPSSDQMKAAIDAALAQ
jgi:protein-disulfide isomerase